MKDTYKFLRRASRASRFKGIIISYRKSKTALILVNRSVREPKRFRRKRFLSRWGLEPL